MFNLAANNGKNNLDKRPKDVFDMEKLFENFFNDMFFPALYGSGSMKADIIENEKEYILKVELPGVEKEEIHLDLRDDKFVVSVQRNEESNEEKENYIRKERKSGLISRAFYMPNVKEDGIKAKYSNGILTIILPKQDKALIRNNKIQIE